MYAVIAVVAGLIAGFVRGGRFSHMAGRPFRFGWLLVSGLVLQIGTELFHLPHLLDIIVVLASYAALAAFAVGNATLGGMGLVAVGLLLNIVPIALNGGMPVRASAIVRAGIVKHPGDVHKLRFGGKRHLQRPGDRVMPLADILPDWVFHEVLSYGDLVLSMGIVVVVVNLLQPARRHRRRSAADAQVGPPLLPAVSPPSNGNAPATARRVSRAGFVVGDRPDTG